MAAPSEQHKATGLLPPPLRPARALMALPARVAPWKRRRQRRGELAATAPLRKRPRALRYWPRSCTRRHRSRCCRRWVAAAAATPSCSRSSTDVRCRFHHRRRRMAWARACPRAPLSSSRTSRRREVGSPCGRQAATEEDAVNRCVWPVANMNPRN
jgi:hypothetical protein